MSVLWKLKYATSNINVLLTFIYKIFNLNLQNILKNEKVY